jgi:hypothetical protein
MFYYKFPDGTHKPMHKGPRPPGAKKVYIEGEVPERLWKEKTVTITKKVYVHPDAGELETDIALNTQE